MPVIDLSIYKPVPGTLEDANQVANGFQAIQNLLNGGLDDANIAVGAGIQASKIAGAMPAGAVVDFAAAAAPAGWLLCDGAAVSRAAFAALFAAIGTGYGVGDGLTTFNVPDYRGRVGVGYAAAGGHADVATLNNNDGQAASNRRPKHRTSNSLGVNAGSLAGSVALFVSGSGAGSANVAAGDNQAAPAADGAAPVTISGTPSLTGSIGTNNGNDALDAPSYIVVNKIIKT